MFETSHGTNLVNEFRELFTKHETDRVFGLVLNHRHFDMGPNERLVEYRGTSVPWNTMLDKTRPSNWLLSADDGCSHTSFTTLRMTM